MIKYISTFIRVAILLLFCSSAFAEPIKLQGNSEILGLWKVVATTPKLDKKKKLAKEKWQFKKDGAFVLLARDHRADSVLQTKSRYIIEDGSIKIANPGRPGKFMIYQVYEKNASSMILQGGLEGFYFLEKL